MAAGKANTQEPSSTSTTKRTIRVVLQRAAVASAPGDISSFSTALQGEVATALDLPFTSIVLLGLYNAGDGAVAADCSLEGKNAGKEAVAAANLAAQIVRQGAAEEKRQQRDLQDPTSTAQRPGWLLQGAEVQLVTTPSKKVADQDADLGKSQVGVQDDGELQKAVQAHRSKSPPRPLPSLQDASTACETSSALSLTSKDQSTDASSQNQWMAQPVSVTSKDQSTDAGSQSQWVAGPVPVRSWASRVPPPPPITRIETRLVGKPKLNPEIESLLAEADRLLVERPRRNTRLGLLEREVTREKAASRIAVLWEEVTKKTRNRLAAAIQRAWRKQRDRKAIALLRHKRAASIIARTWRYSRVRRTFLLVLRKHRSTVRIQSLFRGWKEREAVYRRLVALHSITRIIMLKVRVGRQARRIRRRVSAAHTLGAASRGSLARQEATRRRQELVDNHATAVFLQDVLRAKVSKMHFQKVTDAANTIRACYSRIKIRRLVRQIVDNVVHKVKSERASRAMPVSATSLGQAARQRQTQEGAKMLDSNGARLMEDRSVVRQLQEPVFAASPKSSAFVSDPEPSEAWSGGIPGAQETFRRASEAGKRILSAFEPGLLGSKMALSQNGLSATNTCEDSREDAFCIVFGNGRLPITEHGFYFEVGIDQTIDGELDGLTLGLTLEPPEFFNDSLPEQADDVPQSWSIGYNGQAFSCNSAEMTPIDWQPSDLKVGDRVGLLVDRSGDLWLYCNGRQETRGPDKLPTTLPLYPFLGVIGNTRAITLLPGAKAGDAEREHGSHEASLVQERSPQPARSVLSGFSHELATSAVMLTADSLSAERKDPQGVTFRSVLFGNGHVPVFDEGAYFEVQLRKTLLTQPDGLVVGVTTMLPTAESLLSFESAEDVPNCWSFGFDGQAVLVDGRGAQVMTPLGWSPTDLRVGDRVGLLITVQGEAKIYVNSEVVVSGVGGLPAGASLFPVVDLLGNAVAVSLLLGQKPRAPAPAALPDLKELDEKSKHVSAPVLAFARQAVPSIVAPPVHRVPASAAANSTHARTDHGQVVPQIPAPARGQLGTPAASAALASQATPPAQAPAGQASVSAIQGLGLTGFLPHLLSPMVRLSQDGLTATHQNPQGSVVQGVVFGNGPIAVFSSGAYFEVQMMAAQSCESDGLVIGVTTALPTAKPNPPFDTADMVPSSWCFGFDGIAILHGKDEDVPLTWSPKDLRTGDRVGLLVSPSGEAKIYCNGILVVSQIFGLPTSVALYPVVDLLGNAVAVSLLPGALPPDQVLSPTSMSIDVGALPPQGKTFDGFETSLCSPLVSINGLIAQRTGVSVEGDGLEGVCLGDGPLQLFPAGAYFEVCIEAKAEGFNDGLTLGVTTELPAKPSEPFLTADEVPKSWSYGFDGSAHVDGSTNMLPIGWSPATLSTGDRAGLLIAPSGELHLLVNGTLVTSLIRGLRTDISYFPIIDLLGSAKSVSLRPGVTPPQVQPPASPEFFRGLLGESVRISQDGLKCKSTDATGEMMFGVVFGTEPITPGPAGRYFEVLVDQVRENANEDGLSLGITVRDPSQMARIEKPFEVSDMVPDSWTAGYNGFYRSLHFADDAPVVQLGWNPATLQKGDRVGCLISRVGDFVLTVNGNVVARVPDELPLADADDVWVIVDLLGRVSGVTLFQNATPPQAATAGAIFSGFNSQPLSKTVQLLQNGLSAVSNDAEGDQLGGVAFGNGPLPCCGPDGEAYFEVRVDQLRSGHADGLVMGVTANKPSPTQAYEVADQIEDSWSLGYDGKSLAPDLQEMEDIPWNPSSLRVGEKVGLLVTGQGALILLVNGEVVYRVPPTMEPVPVADVPLFPFIDLLGMTKAVSLTKPSKALVTHAANRLQRTDQTPAGFDAW